MTRDELVDAGAEALADPRYPTGSTDRYHRNIAGMVLDAVEPLILADLRAEVEALVEYVCPEWSVEADDDLGRHLRKDQVLALIDGAGR